MPQGASQRRLGKSLKPHLARQKGKRLRETRDREGMIKSKIRGKRREVKSQKGAEVRPAEKVWSDREY
jgi:hypothetical protein